MKVIKVNGRKILAGIGILLVVGLLSGCSEVQKFSWEKLKETHIRMITGRTVDKGAKPAQAKEEQAAVGAKAVGKVSRTSNEAAAEDKGKTQANRKVNVALYFADRNGEYLKVEKSQIPFVQGLARATVEALIAGPRQKNLTKTFPDGAKLLDINIQDGLCTVDMSKEFKENHWGGSSGEILTVYSLVNTLTQFPTVEKVEILVEGQKIDTLAGHMDLSTPVFRNSQIIKN